MNVLGPVGVSVQITPGAYAPYNSVSLDTMHLTSKVWAEVVVRLVDMRVGTQRFAYRLYGIRSMNLPGPHGPIVSHEQVWHTHSNRGGLVSSSAPVKLLYRQNLHFTDDDIPHDLNSVCVPRDYQPQNPESHGYAVEFGLEFYLYSVKADGTHVITHRLHHPFTVRAQSHIQELYPKEPVFQAPSRSNHPPYLRSSRFATSVDDTQFDCFLGMLSNVLPRLQGPNGFLMLVAGAQYSLHVRLTQLMASRSCHMELYLIKITRVRLHDHAGYEKTFEEKVQPLAVVNQALFANTSKACDLVITIPEDSGFTCADDVVEVAFHLCAVTRHTTQTATKSQHQTLGSVYLIPSTDGTVLPSKLDHNAHPLQGVHRRRDGLVPHTQHPGL